VDIKLRTEGRIAARDLHLVRVRVNDPLGHEVTSLRRNVILRGGAAQVHLPIAFDDSPGNWSISLRDAVTGASATLEETPWGGSTDRRLHGE